MYVLSQILVLFADSLYVASMLNKKKINLTMLLLLSDILFASHYLCLKAYTGAAVIFIDVVFLIAIYLIEKFHKDNFTLLIVLLTMLATVISGIVTWDGAISLLPIFAMLVYLSGMIFTNMVFVKAGSVVRNLLNILYMALIASYVGAGLEFILMLSGIVGMVISYRYKKMQNNENKNELI